jgi:hypothetical protein
MSFFDFVVFWVLFTTSSGATTTPLTDNLMIESDALLSKVDCIITSLDVTFSGTLDSEDGVLVILAGWSVFYYHRI